MPRVVRQTLTVASFAIFFAGTLVLGVFFVVALFPVLLVSRRAYRGLVTAAVGRGFGTFIYWMRFCRLFTHDRIELPEHLVGRPYMLVANHPSLIDVLFLLHACEGLTSVVKGSWYRSVFFGPLLRSLNYLPADRGEHVSTGGTPALDAMVSHLQQGHALVAFPEGTRSGLGGLRRFRRGPFEAAVRAGVPIVSVFIGVEPRILMKGQPMLDVPEVTPHFTFNVRRVIEAGDDDGQSAEEIRREVSDDLRACFDAHRARDRSHFEMVLGSRRTGRLGGVREDEAMGCIVEEARTTLGGSEQARQDQSEEGAI